MHDLTLAYLAGVIDSDGYLSVKRTTYHMRVRGDAGNPVFSEKIGCKQVTPEAIDLLHATFNGYRRVEKPSTANGRPLHSWVVTDRNAAAAAEALLPFLRIKREQAILLLQLRALKSSPRIETGEFDQMANQWGSTTTRAKKRVAPETISAMEELRLLSMSLNRR